MSEHRTLAVRMPDAMAMRVASTPVRLDTWIVSGVSLHLQACAARLGITR